MTPLLSSHMCMRLISTDSMNYYTEHTRPRVLYTGPVTQTVVVQGAMNIHSLISVKDIAVQNTSSWTKGRDI